MEVHVSLVGRKVLTGEIYRQLRRAILDGRLPAGGRLPTTRELARRLSVSRTTVEVAYDPRAHSRRAGRPLEEAGPPGMLPVRVHLHMSFGVRLDV